MIEKFSLILNSNVDSCDLIGSSNYSKIYRCRCKDEFYIFKVANSNHIVEIEYFMLTYLKQVSSLNIASPIILKDNILVMEYIKNDRTHLNYKDVALMLSSLHRVTDKNYGLFKDTSIGPFIQSNKQNSSWVEFFKNERILNFSHKAH